MYPVRGARCTGKDVLGPVTALISYVQKAGLREGERPVGATVSIYEPRLSEPHPEPGSAHSPALSFKRPYLPRVLG